jgi:hypothetical protein
MRDRSQSIYGCNPLGLSGLGDAGFDSWRANEPDSRTDWGRQRGRRERKSGGLRSEGGGDGRTSPNSAGQERQRTFSGPRVTPY